MIKQFARFGAAGLSGLLLFLSHPGASLWFAAWVALVPLLWAASGSRQRWYAFVLGWVAGFAFYATSISWITNVIDSYSQMPGIVPFLLMLVLAAIMACYYGFFAMAVQLAARRRFKLGWLFIIVAFVCLEWLQSWVLTGFPWNLLGYTQLPVLPMIQVADIAGVYAVSFLVTAINVLIFSLIQQRQQLVSFVRSIQFISLSAIIVASLVYGFWQLSRDYSPGEGFTATVIQDKYDNQGRWNAGNMRLFDYYEQEALDAVVAGSDVVLFGEGAFNGLDMMRANGRGSWTGPDIRESLLFSHAKTWDFWLLMGSNDYVNETQTLYNTAVTVSPENNGQVTGRYAKTHLTPFGEYVPFTFIFGFVEQIVPEIYSFGTGDILNPIPLLNGAAGVPICYEVTFPDLVRQFSNNGATVLATLSNDAWFGRSAANQQHFNMAAMRSVENRRYMMRCAVSGVSGFVHPSGRILAQTDVYEFATLTEQIHMLEGKTIYAQAGDIFILPCIGLVILHLLPLGWLSRSSK